MFDAKIPKLWRDRQLLHLAEELPDAAHALNVCTILHRLAKGGSAGSQGGEEWDWEAVGIFRGEA